MAVNDATLLMRPADDWWIPLFFEILTTDWCVCGTHSWVNMRSPTRWHSPQYMYSSRSSTAWMAANWTGACQVFLGASEDLTRSSCYLKFFEQLLCSVAFKQTQVLIKMRFSLLNTACLQTAMKCENASFLLLWNIAK